MDLRAALPRLTGMRWITFADERFRDILGRLNTETIEECVSGDRLIRAGMS